MLTVGEAATRLGVSPEQVRRLVRTGKLAARKIGATVILDDDEVERRLRLHVRAGRDFAPRSAWGALWLLSGEAAPWLSPAERSRLRRRLRGWTAEQLVAAERSRADRVDVRILPRYLDLALAHPGVVAGGMTAAGVVGADVVAAQAPAEVYCTADVLAGLRAQLGLSDRGEANLIIRLPRGAVNLLEGRQVMPDAAVAADLAESPDPRTRKAGLALLTAALADLAQA